MLFRSANSGSLGAAWQWNPVLALSSNFAYTERAPTFYELYSNGPHVATNAYEVGNRAFATERSTAIDIALRAKAEKLSGSVSVFHNRFQNYLTLVNAGNRRGADGELNPLDANGDGIADGSGAKILRELQYRAVPARFRGVEAEGKYRVWADGAASLDALLKYDQVHEIGRAHV